MPHQFNASISTFEALARIAERHRITDTEWAKAVAITTKKEIRQPTISEFRKILTLMKEQGMEQAEAERVAERKVTAEKILELIGGLRHMIGDRSVTQHLDEILSAEPDPIVKVFIVAKLAPKSVNEDVLNYYKVRLAMVQKDSEAKKQ